jgi:hypothetical protein
MTEQNEVLTEEIKIIEAETEAIYRGCSMLVQNAKGGAIVSGLMLIIIEVIQRAQPELQQISCAFLRQIVTDIEAKIPAINETVQ